MKDDHRSYIRNFCSCEPTKRKPEKKLGLYGIRTLELCDTERSNLIPYKP